MKVYKGVLKAIMYLLVIIVIPCMIALAGLIWLVLIPLSVPITIIILIESYTESTV